MRTYRARPDDQTVHFPEAEGPWGKASTEEGIELNAGWYELAYVEGKLMTTEMNAFVGEFPDREIIAFLDWCEGSGYCQEVGVGEVKYYLSSDEAADSKFWIEEYWQNYNRD
jgi:hypothetical protein